MKKSVLMLLILSILFSFAGCGKAAEQTSSSAPNTLAITEDSSVAETSTEQTSSISTVVVPDVVGMDKDEAVKKLEDLGLKVELVKVIWQYENDTAVAHNVVIEQGITSGTVMVSGSSIELTYNLQENGYSYKVNEDGTITIVSASVYFLNETDALIIPKEYDGYAISKISAEAPFQIGRAVGYPQQERKVKIPKEVEIDSQYSYFNFETY